MTEKCADNCPLIPRVEALERANEQHGSTHREMYGQARETLGGAGGKGIVGGVRGGDRVPAGENRTLKGDT